MVKDSSPRSASPALGLPRRLRRALGRVRRLLQLPDEIAALAANLAELRRQQAALDATMRTEMSEIIGRERFLTLQRELSARMAFTVHDIVHRLVEDPNHPFHPPSPFPIEGTVDSAKAQDATPIGAQPAAGYDQLFQLVAGAAAQLADLTALATEIRNTASHLDTSLHTRLDTIEYVRLGGVYDQMQELTAALLRLRTNMEADPEPWAPTAQDSHWPAPRDVLDASLRRAQDEYPRIYPMWAERLEEMRKACLETRVGNVAQAGETASEAFRSLLEIHAGGRTLDVGCGVFGRPYYLAGYSPALLSGLDPLEPVEPPDFEFVRGIQEYLPWPDGAFSTVVSATSLDHCLSLDRSLAEIRRVLQPGGTFLLWIGSIPGARCYEPEAADFAPADRYHLFHFDAAWLEPMLAREFDTAERIRLRGLAFDHLMYCLRLRAT